MTTNDTASFEAALARYGHFQECLLKDLCWDRFGTTIHLDFEYIWDEAGPEGGRVLGEPRRVRLSMLGVQELNIRNALTEAMLAEPERLDWGIGEIAQVRIEPGPDFGSSAEPDGSLHRLIVEWESERRIDALCSELRLTEVGDRDS